MTYAHKYCLQTLLNVLNFALENGIDKIVFAMAIKLENFQNSILQQRHMTLPPPLDCRRNA
jgi:hypothetical protein